MTSAPNPLWNFAVHFYARPGVPAVCLALQDEHEADVNLLLFLLWCAAAGRLLSQDDVRRFDDEVRGWRDGAVVPLRALRRRLKGVALIEPAQQQAFRDKVQTLEQEAERTLQDALYGLSQSQRFGMQAPPGEAARDNIAAYERALARNFPGAAIAVLIENFAAVAGERTAPG